MAEEEIKKVGCRFCGATCGLLAYIQNGKVVKIKGNPDHRLSRGFMCERPRHAIKWLYHPDQLLYPLKRIGKRGEGRWQRISTDDAIGEIAGKLNDLKKKYGPETLAFFEGTYRAESMWARSRFGNIFGSPHNVFHPGVICGLNCFAMSQAIMGDSTSQLPDIARTNCLVFSGQRPHESAPRTIASLTRRRNQGPLKIIVIDPIKTKIAEMADIHLQIRPGTDAALFLGWINVIIDEKLYDGDFVLKWTGGFDKLAERAREYPPDRVAEITGLTASQIAQSARLYATTKPACLFRGVAADQIGMTSSRVEQTRGILRALTGNIDIPGGDLCSEIGPVVQGRYFVRDTDLELLERLPIAQREKMIGSDKAPLMSWKGYELIAEPWEKKYHIPSPTIHRLGAFVPGAWEAILTGKPYPLTAAITLGSNPMMWAPDTKKVYQAFMSENLALHVIQEFWITPTAQLADYILPAASWLESPVCGTHEDFFPVVCGGERAVQPLGERMDDYLFWRKLALAVGQEESDWPWKTLEEVIAYRIKPLGITYDEYTATGYLLGNKRYKKYEEEGFPTHSGKVDLYSDVLEKMGQDPLPFYQEPPETPVSAPQLAREYPFILTTGGRFMPMFHSEHRQLGIGMREKHPDPLATIHPQTAEQCGIKNGDWIWIETPRGRITQKANVYAGILPSVVNVEASWWFPEKPGAAPSLFGVFESNANMLTADGDEFCDPLTGGWTNRALLCKVYKNSEYVSKG